MKILFFGTPAYTLPYLELLSEQDEVCGVISPPDRTAGRGLKLVSPAPVKWARSNNIPVLQPEKLADPEFQSAVSSLKADLGIIVAYGKIIPEAVFTLPANDCLNLHFSLLPRYRGASPIESALLGGDRISGVTLQRITMELDAGDILCTKEVAIPEEYHFPEFFEALHNAGGDLLREGLTTFRNSTPVFTPQNHAEAVVCGKIRTGDRDINWDIDAQTVRNTIRAFSGQRTAFSTVNGHKHFLHRAGSVYPEMTGKPGTVLQADKNGFIIACGSGAVAITEIQRENKKRMSAAAFVNGNTVAPGDRFNPSI